MCCNHLSVWLLVPPRFVTEPKSQAVAPTSPVLFTSVFEGTPPFTIKWFKDDIELITGPSCTIRTEKYASSVELHSVSSLTCGIYSCHIHNEAGTVKSTAELLVKGRTILFSLSTIATQLTPSFFLHFYSFSFSIVILSTRPLHHFFSFQDYLCCLQNHLSTSSIHHIDQADNDNLIFF